MLKEIIKVKDKCTARNSFNFSREGNEPNESLLSVGDCPWDSCVSMSILGQYSICAKAMSQTKVYFQLATACEPQETCEACFLWLASKLNMHGC